MEEKQKNILHKLFETNDTMSKKNLFTLNLPNVYDKIKIKNDNGQEIEIDDETWKLFNGKIPEDRFLNYKLQNLFQQY